MKDVDGKCSVIPVVDHAMGFVIIKSIGITGCDCFSSLIAEHEGKRSLINKSGLFVVMLVYWNSRARFDPNVLDAHVLASHQLCQVYAGFDFDGPVCLD